MRAKLYSHPLRAALREVQHRLWLRESRRVQLLPPSSRDLPVIDEPLNRVAERYVRRRNE